MVSPFDVYLVMQLDSIGSMFLFFALVGSFVAVVLCLFGSIEEEPAVLSWGRKVAAFAILSTLASGLLPSSKTAAAMILIPALTSEEVVAPVSAEARELYGLAKAALRNVAEREPKPEPKSED